MLQVGLQTSVAFSATIRRPSNKAVQLADSVAAQVGKEDLATEFVDKLSRLTHLRRSELRRGNRLRKTATDLQLMDRFLATYLKGCPQREKAGVKANFRRDPLAFLDNVLGQPSSNPWDGIIAQQDVPRIRAPQLSRASDARLLDIIRQELDRLNDPK